MGFDCSEDPHLIRMEEHSYPSIGGTLLSPMDVDRSRADSSDQNFHRNSQGSKLSTSTSRLGGGGKTGSIGLDDWSLLGTRLSVIND